MPEQHIQETIRLATLALSRLSSKFDKSSDINASNYIEQLRQFDNFEYMLNYIKNGLKLMTVVANKSNA